MLHRPNWIFIEEATDALSADRELEMMQLVFDEFPAATVLTIGHHPALEILHQRKLSPRDRRGATRGPNRRQTKPAE